jgi:hypothetical protein
MGVELGFAEVSAHVHPHGGGYPGCPCRLVIGKAFLDERILSKGRGCPTYVYLRQAEIPTYVVTAIYLLVVDPGTLPSDVDLPWVQSAGPWKLLSLRQKKSGGRMLHLRAKMARGLPTASLPWGVWEGHRQTSDRWTLFSLQCLARRVKENPLDHGTGKPSGGVQETHGMDCGGGPTS